MDKQNQSAESPAEIYEHFIVPAIFVPWLPTFLELASLRPGDRVLDVACGTGVIAREAVSQVGPEGSVVGIDINPNMLDMARVIEPSVDWRECNAQDLPFDDEEFDVVVCQQGLQFFSERDVALREMRRVLKPGGCIALASWRDIESIPGHYALAQAIEKHVSSEAAALMSSGFRLGDADTIRTLLEESGFRDVRVHREGKTASFPSPQAFVRNIVAGSALGRAGGVIPEELMTVLIRDVEAALQPYVNNDILTFPMESHLATA